MKGMLKKLLFLSLFMVLFVGAAYAETTDPMEATLCNIYLFITGGIGKTICAFTIIGVGIGFFTGKVSWGVLIGVALGIASLFGGPAIMQAIAGGEAPCKDITTRQELQDIGTIITI